MSQFFVVTIATERRTLFYDVAVDETAGRTFDPVSIVRPSEVIAVTEIIQQGGPAGASHAEINQDDPGQPLEKAMTSKDHPGVFVWPRGDRDDHGNSASST